MPKKAMDYSQTIIYKLVCNDLNIKECYIGHTTSWKHRKTQHKQSVIYANHKDYNSKKSTYIREHGGWSNWSMIQIELYPCNTQQDAGARERYWYEILGAGLNTQVPNRSNKEWREHYCDKLKKYHKQKYENNKEERKEKCQCECGSTTTIYNKTRHLKTLKHCQYIDSLLLDKPIGELTNEN